MMEPRLKFKKIGTVDWWRQPGSEIL